MVTVAQGLAPATNVLTNNSDGTSNFTLNGLIPVASGWEQVVGWGNAAGKASKTGVSISKFSGANGTGTLLSKLVNSSDNTSLLVEYSFSKSSGIMSRTSLYSGVNASGTLRAQEINYSNGTSVLVLNNAGQTGSNIVSICETDTYSRWDAMGTLLSKLVNTVYKDGTYSNTQSVNTPSSGIANTTNYFSSNKKLQYTISNLTSGGS